MKEPVPGANADRERGSLVRWATFITVLFVAQVGLWVAAVVIVSGDRSHAVVEGYDAQAMSWDEQRAQQRDSDATGWHVQVDLRAAASVPHGDNLQVRVTDRDGRPVLDAQLEARLFHHARAGELTRLKLHPGPDGTYLGAAALRRPGKWTVVVEGARGTETVVDRQTVVMAESG
jgi:nitrogen fixation protein FixH